MAMVGYATFGTNEPERSGKFYDALLALLGAKRIMEIEGFVLWGTSFDDACFALTPPFDKNPATVGNGVMVALRADSKAAVDAIHAKALELGGSDEGAPGPRGDGFYAGYFRDLEGNKLNAFFLG
jgi:catechol 2,3-dioxygenase-like lactoylglutathione lyase family enzyme